MKFPAFKIKLAITLLPLASLFCETVPGIALCQTSIQIEESKKHFKIAVALFQDGNFREALEEFKKSYDLRPHWGIFYNIGICYLRLNNKGKALMLLTRFLEEGGTQIPPQKVSEVEDVIKQLASQVGIVRFIGNLEGANVLVDGEYYPEANENMFLYLDAGQRYIRITKDQNIIYENKVSVKGNQEVTIYIMEPAPNKPEKKEVEDKNKIISPAGAKQKVQIPETILNRKKKLKTTGIILGGLSGVTVIGYIVSGAVALSEKQKMEDVANKWNKDTRFECLENGDCEEKMQEALDSQQLHYDRAKNSKMISNIFFGVGMAFVVTSMGIFIASYYTGKNEKNINSNNSIIMKNININAGPDGFFLELSF